MKIPVFFVFSILIVSSCVFALEGTHIISNSEDWRDVYSVMLYSKLSGRIGSFLVSTSHGPIILNGIKKSNSIGVVSSKNLPFVINYPSLIRPKGYQGVNEILVDSSNLELIEENEIEDIKKFIIIGDSYGYNAIAVSPYAILTRSWVFFANRINIAEIDAILERKDTPEVLIYGYVDREVNEVLSKYNPEIINTGDRFEDNIEIVKKFRRIENAKQITLTNGEFLEQEVMNSRHPVLFTGRENVPEKIAEYLQGSDISVGVLIGNELIQAATNIRRSAGISVMVKFARSARTPSGGVSQVQGLDLFPLPTPSLDLGVQSIKYNRLSSQLEVTYHSRSNVPLYLKGTITINSDGEKQRVGDIEPVYMAPGDYKTLRYPDIRIDSEKITADFNTLFGEVPTSLDRQLEGSVDVDIINVLDKCEVDIKSIKYVKQSEAFIIKVKNTAEVDCYVDIEFSDIKINNLRQVIGTEGSSFIRAGKGGKIKLEQRMGKEDLKDNPFINLIAYYGQREDSLVKIFKGKFELNIDLFSGLTYAMIVVLTLLLIFVGVIFFMKKRDEEW